MTSKYGASKRCVGAGSLPRGRVWLLVLTMLILAAGAKAAHPAAAHSQDRTPPSGQASSTPARSSGVQPSSSRGPGNALVDPTEDYKIGTGDVIEIKVDDAPELSQTVRVTASGTFLMPYLGRVTAVQKTPEELAEFMAGRLRGRYLKDPKVSVVVKEYNSCSFFIQGAVRSPGVYQIEGHPSLLKLITLAGLADNHGSTAFILRPIIPSAEHRTGPKPDSIGGNGGGKGAAPSAENPSDE